MRPTAFFCRSFSLIALVWAAGVWLPGCFQVLQEGPLRHDYNRRKPEEAFEYLFHRPVPADVQDLAAAGESWIGGSNVWLRFRSSSKTIQELKSVAEKAAPWKRGEDVIRDDASTLIRYGVWERLGWNRVWKLRNAEYFHIGEGPSSTEFVIDRETGTVYAFYYSI